MGRTVKQGDVWWHDFKHPDKRRPVVVLTRNSAIANLESVSVAPVTSTIRSIPTEVLLGESDGLSFGCAVNLDNVQTVPKSRLTEFIARLPVERMRDIREAISFAYGFDTFD